MVTVVVTAETKLGWNASKSVVDGQRHQWEQRGKGSGTVHAATAAGAGIERTGKDVAATQWKTMDTTLWTGLATSSCRKKLGHAAVGERERIGTGRALHRPALTWHHSINIGGLGVAGSDERVLLLMGRVRAGGLGFIL